MSAVDPESLDAVEGHWRWRLPLVVLVVGAVVAGVGLRFVTQSPLWLDEALSVNIARLPLGDIPGALERDGHPPLYYVLLHGWIEAFGTGSVAVRAFSGLWSLALFPLMWVAGARLGGRRVAAYAVALLALSPYAIRYGTETRMYAMVSVLALAGWLLVQDALVKPGRLRLLGIAAVTSALVWTHYWSLWLLAAGGLGLLVHGLRARRRGADAEVRATAAVVGALVVGGLTLLPWLPTLLYQSARTGTPWARPLRPTEMVTYTVADLGGGPQSEAVLLGWLLVAAMGLGLLGRAVGQHTISLDLRSRPEGRPFAVLVSGTLAIACVVGYATGATYASRYAAVFFPFLVLLAALGLERLRAGPVAVGALTALLVLGGVGGVRNVITDRSDAGRSAEAIEAAAEPGDWVVYCPDQLGPATSRLLGADLEQVTYPAFARPERVDWVDYKERLAEASPEAFGTELLERAEGRAIFLVYSPTYTTHEAVCPALYNVLAARRSPEQLTALSEAFEPATVVAFTPR